MKWRINWWYLDGVEGIRRGHDIVEAGEDFDEDDAEELLSGEMWDNLGNQKTENFSKNADSPEPQKWGVLSVRAVK